MRKITAALFLFFALMCAGDVFSQPGPPGGGGNPPCWPPPCIPIDGGIGILILAGIALGGKKITELKKHGRI